MRSLGAFDPAFCASDWNARHPDRWRLSRADFEVQASDPLLLPQFTGISNGGFVIGKLSPQGRLFEGVQTQTLILNSLTDPSLLPEIQETALREGFTRITIGSDESHLTPGIIKEDFALARELREAVAALGWQKSETLQTDLERDLADYALPAFCREAVEAASAQVRPAGAEDEGALETFLQGTFPGRWTYDVMKKFRSGEAHQIDLLVWEKEVVGFSCTQNASSQNPIGGARWRLDLGENWGGLGPIGVSEKVRGKRLGHALLGLSLLRLSQEGARQTIIDWTTLIDFYGVHGFLPARVYESWSWSA